VLYSPDVLLSVRVPDGNPRTPLFMEQALAAIHQGNPQRLPMRLLIAAHAAGVGLFCRLPLELAPVVKSQLFAQYPECLLDELPEDHLDVPHGWLVWTREVALAPHLFPIRRYGQFEEGLERLLADPVASLLAAVVPSSDVMRPVIELTVRPAGTAGPQRARACLNQLARPFFRQHPRWASFYARAMLSGSLGRRLLAHTIAWFDRGSDEQTLARDATAVSTARAHEREEDLQAASDKLGRLNFEARLRLSVYAPADQEQTARRKLDELVGAIGQFSSPRLASFEPSRIRRHVPGRVPQKLPLFLLSTEELATLWHPPTAGVRTETMARVESREMEPPAGLPRPSWDQGVTLLGQIVFRGRRELFGILPEDRLKHTFVIGRTGVGKTTIIQQMALADIVAGRGLAWIDPHGDAIETLLGAIPRERTNDVVLLDAADRAFPVAFNPLACSHPDQRPLVAAGIVTAVKRLFADSFGPRLQYILTNSLLALAEIPQATLALLPRLLADQAFRREVVWRLADPAVRAFFEQEFEPMPPRLRAEAISPIQNKVGAYMTHPILRNILGQGRSALNLRAVMDESKILLVNLSTGRIGDDASTLLGSFLITSLQVAALGRADIAERERKDFQVYVDEAHRYTASSFRSMMAEARKYRLGLCLASQVLDQFDEETRAAILGNIGTLVAFSVGPNDAEPLASFLGGGLTPEDLTSLAKYRAYLRLSLMGKPTRPFSMQTLPFKPPADCQDPKIIRRTSRHRYARPVREVEADLRAVYGHAR
jgi:hypothetical protein